MILTWPRDPRLVTVRRGGTLREDAGRRECQWQRAQLPRGIRALVLDDQRLRNHACWNAFDCPAAALPQSRGTAEPGR